MHAEHEPEVLRLDRQLNEVWRRDLQAQTEEYVPCQAAVSPDDQLMALSGRDSVRITDGAGTLLHTYIHPPWYNFCGTGCFFSPDSRYLWFATPGPAGDDDLLLVLETTGFTVVDQISTQNRYCAYAFHPTPLTDRVIIDTAAGQDGSMMYRARLRADRITLEELAQCQDQIMGNFSPEGDEFVTALVDEGDLRVYSFPEAAEIASVSGEVIGQPPGLAPAIEQDAFEYIVKYITPHLLIALTRFRRLLVIDRQKGQSVGELVPEGYRLQAHTERGEQTSDPARTGSYSGDIVDFYPSAAGQLLVWHGSGTLTVYDISSLESGTGDLAGDLNPQLVALLQRHGLPATLAGGWVQVTSHPEVFIDSRLQYNMQNGFFVSQLDVRLITGGLQINECFADVGKSLEEAKANNLENFSRTSCHPLMAGFFDYPAADIDIETWEIGSRTYQVFLGNYGVKSTGGALVDIPQDLISHLEGFIRQMDLADKYHWVRWFVSQQEGDLDTAEFLVDNQPLRAGEELIRTEPWLQKAGFYSVRHFVLLKRMGTTVAAGTAPSAATPVAAARPKRTFWEWLKGSRK